MLYSVQKQYVEYFIISCKDHEAYVSAALEVANMNVGAGAKLVSASYEPVTNTFNYHFDTGTKEYIITLSPITNS